MINVVLCLAGPVQTAELAQALAGLGEVIAREDGSLTVRTADGRDVTLDRDTDRTLDAEYEPEDLVAIRRAVGADYTGYVMPYRERALVREIALALSRIWPAFIDVDGSFFGTGEQFAAALETGPAWAFDG